MTQITLKTKVRPFTVPNFVSREMPPSPRQDGFKIDPGVPISELDPETLLLLCNEFTDAIFVKAGKERPSNASTDQTVEKLLDAAVNINIQNNWSESETQSLRRSFAAILSE